jgi:hypothetical protein
VTSRTAAVLLAAAAARLAATDLVAAQTPRELGVEWITGPEAEQVTKLPRYDWTGDGAVLLLDERKPPAERTFETLDPQTGARRAAVNRDVALASLKALAG